MKKLMTLFVGVTVSLTALAGEGKATGAFPFDMPTEKPDRPLSAAIERNYDNYFAPRQEKNELFSQFKYTKLKGFDYNGGNGTVSRRDPSKVIFENGKYYVWYTKRDTPAKPVGGKNAHLASDTVATADWDLADIWYATSKDGFTWKEEGVAVPRPPKPQVGWRSVTTTDILKFKDKYYLYYQGFMEASGKRGDDCPVAVSWSDSPDGPWIAHSEVVIPNGKPGEWDQYSIHDPYPLVHNGKIYLYYKSDFDRIPANPDKQSLTRMHGLAIADNPLGPFKKHELNPIMSSGHETTLFPFKKGVAAFAIRDGNERSTIQYAEDWVNFKVASSVELMPDAAGPYVPDAFTDTKYGKGVTWGLSHFTAANGWDTNHSILARWDADLSLDVKDPKMKQHNIQYGPEHHFKYGLSAQQKKRIAQETEKLNSKQ